MNNEMNFLFATFAAGEESKEGKEFPKYTGVAPVKVVGVCPDKAWLKEHMGYEPEDEPQYVFEKDGVKSARVAIYVQIDKEATGAEAIIPLNFWIKDEGRTNKDKTKVQIINAFGETGWITNDQFENGELPENISMSPRGVRQAFLGEANLVDFLRTRLNIPSRTFYKDESWHEISDPELALAQLESIPSYFEGDFSEITDLTGIMPENKLKVWFGVRTTDDNKSYQDFFADRYARNNSSSYDYIEKAMVSAQNAGMYKDTVFGKSKFQEYSESATKFKAPSEGPTDVETARKTFFGKK